jgi:ribosome-binding protein aMBF1 (putative translation factor)
MAKNFMDQIRAAIDDSGMSRYAICKALDFDQASMSRFMSGKAGLQPETLNKLADLLGLEVHVRTPKVRK